MLANPGRELDDGRCAAGAPSDHQQAYLPISPHISPHLAHIFPHLAHISQACNVSTRDSSLYNAMIAPYTIGPMALTGFTWYQVRLRDRLRDRVRVRVGVRVYLLYSRGTRARPTSTSGAATRARRGTLMGGGN